MVWGDNSPVIGGGINKLNYLKENQHFGLSFLYELLREVDFQDYRTLQMIEIYDFPWKSWNNYHVWLIVSLETEYVPLVSLCTLHVFKDGLEIVAPKCKMQYTYRWVLVSYLDTITIHQGCVSEVPWESHSFRTQGSATWVRCWRKFLLNVAITYFHLQNKFQFFGSTCESFAFHRHRILFQYYSGFSQMSRTFRDDLKIKISSRKTRQYSTKLLLHTTAD